jgi:subtilase-type serine protease
MTQFWRIQILLGFCLCICLTRPTAGWAADADSFITAEYQNSTGLDYIHAAEAYALGYTGQGIRLALFDTMVRLDHREFASKIDLQEYVNFANLGWDVNAHGTHVAGIMAAAKDDLGMHGVAFNAGLVALGNNNYDANLDYDLLTLYPKTFADDSLKIINNSWGIWYYPENYRDVESFFTEFNAEAPGILDLFCEAIVDHDKVLVWAAGNHGHLTAQFYSYLGDYEPKAAGNLVNVIAFDPSRSSDAGDFLALFTEHALFAEENSLAAPGVQINSAVPYNNGDEYAKWDGTSMAAPYVSGTLGLVQQAFPYMSGKQLADTVLSTANRDFTLPRYTVCLQADYDESIAEFRGSIYLIYFGDENPSPEQREQDLRDYYAQSARAQATFGDVDTFLKYYYRDNVWYGSERYYTNVPQEIMFGQGLLDAGKAVRGPGILNARRLTDADYSNVYGGAQALYSVDTKGYDSVWSNDIGETRVTEYSAAYGSFYREFYGDLFGGGRYGDEMSYAEGVAYGQAFFDAQNESIRNNILYNLPVGLLKKGAGTLALTGNNSYQGASIVIGGTLQIDGSVRNDVYSEVDGTVAGSGIIGGNLTNRGTVQAGSWDAVGDLTVNGNLTSTGAIAVTVTDTAVSQLIVNGSATVDGSQVIPDGIVIPDATYIFLRAADGITGAFNATQFSPFLTAYSEHDQTTARFQVIKTAALTSLPALNAGRQTSAAAIERLYQVWQGQTLPLEVAAIYNSRTEAAAGAVLQETYGGLQASLSTAAPLRAVIGNALHARLAAASGDRGVTKNDSRTFAVTLADLSTQMELETGSPVPLDAEGHGWLKPFGDWGTLDADPGKGLSAMDTKSSGFILGWDHNVTPAWRLGALCGYGKGELTALNARGDSRDYRIGLYGDYTGLTFDVTAYLVAGTQAHDTQRVLPTLGLTARSAYDGRTAELGVKTKYHRQDQPENLWGTAPYAGLTIQRYQQDGFVETGAGVLSQQAEKLINTEIAVELGLETVRQLTHGRFTATAGYKRVLDGSNPELRVNFVGNPDDEPFLVKGNALNRDWLVLGLNVAGEVAVNWTVTGELRGEFSRRSRNHSVAISLRRYW